jgi:hypothetical protein
MIELESKNNFVQELEIRKNHVELLPKLKYNELFSNNVKIISKVQIVYGDFVNLDGFYFPNDGGYVI